MQNIPYLKYKVTVINQDMPLDQNLNFHKHLYRCYGRVCGLRGLKFRVAQDFSRCRALLPPYNCLLWFHASGYRAT